MLLTKKSFREKCLKKQRTAPKHNKVYKDALLNKKLLHFLEQNSFESILFYYPLGGEADIRKTLEKMRRKSKIYLPFMQGKSFKMVPFRLPLKRKKFGILEAGNTNKKIKNIDLAIVPVVGVDGDFKRVGFGKGMYDRFFEKLPKKPYVLFIQYEFCYTKKQICDSYDIKGDLLLTPTKTLWLGPQKRK